MKLPIRFSLITLAVLTFGILVVSLTHRSKRSSAATAGLSSTGTTAPKQNHAAVTAESVVAGNRSSSHAPGIATSSSIVQALPGLSQRVSNWHDFKPEKITVAPYPDTPYEFEATAV